MQGPSCGCSPGDLGFRLLWPSARVVLRSRLKPTTSGNTRVLGVWGTSAMSLLPCCCSCHRGLCTLLCDSHLMVFSHPGGITGANRVKAALMYHGITAQAWYAGAASPGDTPSWCQKGEELEAHQGRRIRMRNKCKPPPTWRQQRCCGRAGFGWELGSVMVYLLICSVYHAPKTETLL